MRWIILSFIAVFIYGFLFQQQCYGKTVKNTDRVEQSALQRVFRNRHSPLGRSAGFFIQTAKKYKLDYRLLPAIAGVESGFETQGNTTDYNAWGYMCGSNPCVFSSYKQGIETVAKTISGSGMYAAYRQDKSLYTFATIYNVVSPEDYTQKLEYFENEF